MSGSSKKKKARSASAAPVLRSLRLFIVLFTFLAEVITINRGEIVWDRLYAMLPMAAAYIAAVMIARRFDNKLIISLGGVVLAAAAAAAGFDVLSWVFNGILAAAGFANALHDRIILKRTGNKPENIFFPFAGLGALIIMQMISWIAENKLAGQLVFTMTMAYFPLAFCTWLYEGIEYYVGQFANRSTQPVTAVRKNVTEWVVPLIFLIALAAAFMPYKDGRTLAYYLFKGLTLVFYGIIYVLNRLMDLLLSDAVEEGGVSATQLEPNTPVSQNSSAISNTVAAIFSFSVLAVFACSIVFTLVKKLIQAIAAGYSLRPKTGGEDSGNDVVEKIAPSAGTKRRRLFARLTAAEEIREIYKKTVSGLIKYGVKPSDSDSPDEICAAAGEKGFDLSELTDIYKQARYTQSCPGELLSRARYLAKHVEDARGSAS